jgi:hypothetical protein
MKVLPRDISLAYKSQILLLKGRGLTIKKLEFLLKGKGLAQKKGFAKK